MLLRIFFHARIQGATFLHWCRLEMGSQKVVGGCFHVICGQVFNKLSNNSGSLQLFFFYAFSTSNSRDVFKAGIQPAAMAEPSATNNWVSVSSPLNKCGCAYIFKFRQLSNILFKKNHKYFKKKNLAKPLTSAGQSNIPFSARVVPYG